MPPEKISSDKFEIDITLLQFSRYNVSLTAINCNGEASVYLEIGNITEI